MYGNVKHARPFDAPLIDDRNERPLTIALATIVAVWSIAFALTFASGHGPAHAPDSLNSAASAASSMNK